MKPVHPKGHQSWIFIGKTDAEAETPILWPPDSKSWPIGKQPNGGEDWRQKEMGMADDEMIRYHHQLNGHEFEQTLGDSEGQRSLMCYSRRDHKESDMTSLQNNSNNSCFHLCFGSSWNSSTLATSCEELTHWKRLWCWEGLRAGEGDDRGWDGWMASLTRWIWIWVNSGSWWWTGRPGMLRFMGSQRVRHDWATELNWTELYKQH